MLPVNSMIGLLASVGNAANIEDVMNNGMTLGERLTYGLQMTGIGLLTIFAVLGIIYLTMLLFRLAFYDIPNRRKQSGKAEAASAPAPVTAAPAPAAPTAPAQDDAIIAVLTAAVAAILADEAAANGTAPLPFRVVSFRRAAKGCGWNSKS